MAHFWQSLRNGSWLTPDRLRGYSLLMLGFGLAGLLIWLALSDHLVDRNGKPIGTDFSSFYAAGSLALEGRAAEAYDAVAHYAREQRLFGTATPYYAWQYPPIFLLVATPLALLPYPLALAVWQGGTLLLDLLVIAAIIRRIRKAGIAIGHVWLVVAAAFPAVFVNLGHGQNGLLTAGLLGAALLVRPQRPILAGVLFGLLAYKPQFALIFPVAMIAGGHWRSLIAAAATVVALAAAATLAFGAELWPAFVASTDASRRLLLEQGDVGFEKLQSAFAAVRLIGGGVPLAYAIQAMVSAGVIVGTAWAWRTRLDDSQQAAILMVATLLASPHVLDYDLTVLGPAIAFAAMTGFTRGFRDGEISILAAAWTVPLLARAVAGASAIPLGVLVVGAFYAVLLRRAIAERHAAPVTGTHLARA